MVIISLWLYHSQLDSFCQECPTFPAWFSSFFTLTRTHSCMWHLGGEAVWWLQISGGVAESLLANIVIFPTPRRDKVASIHSSVSSLLPMNCVFFPPALGKTYEFTARASTIIWSRSMYVFWIACPFVTYGTILMPVGILMPVSRRQSDLHTSQKHPGCSGEAENQGFDLKCPSVRS